MAHKLLNCDGNVVEVTAEVLRRLDRWKLLRRNRKLRMPEMKPEARMLIPLLETPAFPHKRRVRACWPELVHEDSDAARNGRTIKAMTPSGPKGGFKGHPVMMAFGEGARLVYCHCRKCRPRPLEEDIEANRTEKEPNVA